ncbi:nitroreductase family protein [bacterium]|nr:nitroreductase family protein [candidate division CSSED10-310 bacterium]
MQALSKIRGGSSAPIGRAPLAAAICVDPEKTLRIEQDGCIAAAYLILAAWHFGLGTCWIGDMDRDTVKSLLGIPRAHHVATVTPIGYPLERTIPAPPRRETAYFLR